MSDFPSPRPPVAPSASWRRVSLGNGLLLFGWLLLLGYLALKFYQRNHFIDLLPTAIEPASVRVISGESGLSEGCGVAIFRLSAAARARLLRGGWPTLATARQARGYADPLNAYAAWQHSPVPDRLIGSEGWMAFACADVDQALERRIHAALRRPGAFYSTTHDAMLLVIPTQGLIVYGYSG
ncbi:MAG: hypothetical protein ABWY06_03705 [Pseudomonas sp.]|uniref:hypothetical protein n=1 Tax=Pseudomonas sp. TaxID=306 RepID=UPI00339A488C